MNGQIIYLKDSRKPVLKYQIYFNKAKTYKEVFYKDVVCLQKILNSF